MATLLVKWEYKIIQSSVFGVNTEEFTEVLNKAGDEGWEAVGITGHESTCVDCVLIKRKKSEKV